MSSRSSPSYHFSLCVPIVLEKIGPEFRPTGGEGGILRFTLGAIFLSGYSGQPQYIVCVRVRVHLCLISRRGDETPAAAECPYHFKNPNSCPTLHLPINDLYANVEFTSIICAYLRQKLPLSTRTACSVCTVLAKTTTGHPRIHDKKRRRRRTLKSEEKNGWGGICARI